DAGADLPLAAVLAADDAEVGELGLILGEDLGRGVGGAVVDDDPEVRRARLGGDGIERPPHVGGFVAAGADEYQLLALTHVRSLPGTSLARLPRGCRGGPAVPP